MLSETLKNLRRAKGLTLEELAEKIGTSKQTISRYEKGVINNIPREKIEALARALDTTPSELMGWSSPVEDLFSRYDNLMPIRTRKLPMLGEISCGKPIFANEDRESFAAVGIDVHADFCLTAKGESMIGARIYDGDLVFIRSQEIVNNGEIAAVIIGDEATLKRVYYYPEQSKLILSPENTKFEPLVYIGEELEEIKILGKAVAFQSNIR